MEYLICFGDCSYDNVFYCGELIIEVRIDQWMGLMKFKVRIVITSLLPLLFLVFCHIFRIAINNYTKDDPSSHPSSWYKIESPFSKMHIKA